LCRSVLVEGLRELRDGGRDFETLIEDDLLPLQADVFGPFDESGEVCFRTDILTCSTNLLSACAGSNKKQFERAGRRLLTDTKILGFALEQRVLLGLSDLGGAKGSGGGLLSGSRLGFWLGHRGEGMSA
jgi:hypothetical protein